MPRRLDPEKGIPGLFTRGRSKSQDMAFLVEDAATPKPRRGGSKGRRKGDRRGEPDAATPVTTTALVHVACPESTPGGAPASRRRSVPVTTVPPVAVDVPVAVVSAPRVVVRIEAVESEELVVAVSIGESGREPAGTATGWTRESSSPEVARLLRAIRQPREAPLMAREVPALLACAGAWLATAGWGLLAARF